MSYYLALAFLTIISAFLLLPQIQPDPSVIQAAFVAVLLAGWFLIGIAAGRD